MAERIWQKNYPDGTPSDIDMAGHHSINQLFHDAVGRFGDQVAFSSFGTTLTYQDVDRMSRDFGAYLQNELGVKKIVTSGPHCYNTLKNEYHQFGGNYEVIAHTELIKTLISEGRIKPELKAEHKGAVVYHDSCYLGRYNKVYDVPREIACAVPGTNLVEPERQKNTSFCCGAGGGRMWMEENIGNRINSIRCDQLLETGAKTFATACPFCLIMLDDAIKEKNLEDEVKILDLAEMIDRSVK